MMLLRRASRSVLRGGSGTQTGAVALTAHLARSASSAGGVNDASSGHGDGRGVTGADAAEKASENAPPAASDDSVTVSIDRSGLFRPTRAWGALTWHPAVVSRLLCRRALALTFHTSLLCAVDPSPVVRPGDSPLVSHLRSLIHFRGGPLSVAEFMHEALTHPEHGYYMSHDVFGTGGDFVTSPEISQLFGELLGVWSATLWQQLGRPQKLCLVELGPGRGTLMADVLRFASSLPPFLHALDIHLVEVSPALRRMQASALGCGPSAGAVGVGQTPTGVSVTWHSDFGTVPDEDDTPLVVLAHEFFDALPVHQFQRTPDRGWVERLVDCTHSTAEAQPLRFVLSPGATPASRVLVPYRLGALPQGVRQSVMAMEMSPKAMSIWQDIASRVAKRRGGALAIDYGDEGPLAFTVQAIKQHAFCEDLLADVGTADLSAHVDFGALRLAAHQVADVTCHGPVTQRQLLASLGIEHRLQALVAACGEDVTTAEALFTGALRLVDTRDGNEASMQAGGVDARAPPAASPGMGLRYKCLALTHTSLGPPVGFEPGGDTAAVSDTTK